MMQHNHYPGFGDKEDENEFCAVVEEGGLTECNKTKLLLCMAEVDGGCANALTNSTGEFKQLDRIPGVASVCEPHFLRLPTTCWPCPNLHPNTNAQP